MAALECTASKKDASREITRRSTLGTQGGVGLSSYGGKSDSNHDDYYTMLRKSKPLREKRGNNISQMVFLAKKTNNPLMKQ